MKKKYLTEEERLAAKRAYIKQWREANKNKLAEYYKQYNQANREKIAEQKKHYKQANKEKLSEYHKQYNKSNKEKLAEYAKQYYTVNKKNILEQMKQYKKTPMGRALYLVSAYRQNDKKYNRGECTLTAKWIVNNIFTSKCHYCEESDWKKLGCDRINNSLPHTEDNVVPCCEKCNNKKGTKSYEEFINEIKKETS